MLRTVLISPEQNEYARITDLLPTVFPKEELPARNIADHVLPYLCFYEDEVFIGFAQVMKTPELQYLRYMAMLPQFRSRGYGGKMLELILSERGNVPLALDIEPLDGRAANAEQRLRRFRFYQKHRMVDSGYDLEYDGNPFWIMSTGENTVPAIMQKYCAADRAYAGRIRIIRRACANV